MYKKSVVYVLIAVFTLSALALMVIPSLKKQAKEEKAKIAVIYVEGVINGGRSQMGMFSEQGGTDEVIKQLHEARDDKSVKAVVLRINSPGGSAPAAQEVGEEIKKLRASGKLVVASMGDMAASGGYWLAAVSDKIYANPATLTGSIGVYIPYTNLEELYKKIGLHQEKIKSGVYKDILSPERTMTAKERELIQVMVDDLYEQFVAVVAEGRHMDPAKVRSLADGRVYTGHQAKDLGLVDEYGNLYDAIDGAAALAGFKGKPEIVEYGKKNPLAVLVGADSKLSFEKLIMKQLADGQATLLQGPLALPLSEGR